MQRFVFIPWIRHQYEVLLNEFSKSEELSVDFIDFPGLMRQRSLRDRLEFMRYALKEREAFRSEVIELLAEAPRSAHGLIVTHDWPPGLHDIVQVFRDLGVPVVLIPHESVFGDRDKFYSSELNGVSAPIADHILVWGNLQREIFEERGVPPQRMTIVGSPKLESTLGFRSEQSRAEYLTARGLDPERRTILFATQPLDQQFGGDSKAAQQRAILDTYEIARANGYNIVVRLHPARGIALLGEVAETLNSSAMAFIEDPSQWPGPPLESIVHTDLIVSFNSTMLLEASFLSRPAISLAYVPFNELWVTSGGMPKASNAQELSSMVSLHIGSGGRTLTAEGWRWVQWAFSPGDFDGAAFKRIADYLRKNLSKEYDLQALAQQARDAAGSSMSQRP
jgi:hypothetical protein